MIKQSLDLQRVGALATLLITVALLMVISTAKASDSAITENSEKIYTLVAEITVLNRTDQPIQGYIHRIAIPVDGHMQQRVLAVRPDGVSRIERKAFDHGAGEYLELEWDIFANEESIKRVYFDILVDSYQMPVDEVERSPGTLHSVPDKSYLEPSKYIESEASEIVRLARHIERSYSDPEARLRAAYLTPQQLIAYRRQPTRGALYAVTARQGDCTEFSALFVALARALGYPARMTSEFLFTEKRAFSQPNHHAAEVYLNSQWIPVDANLALDPSFGYGFGEGQNRKIVLNRNSVWVWSNLFPRGVSKRRGKVDVSMHWRILDGQGVD
ncbi:transglutaminase-like domain-containing protein [Microbulbifer agarilyticus]|uniref:transglutaminase-like domain-containing protein n=1 Tax=Microbulbifer agarilyticus TaxID=260552 RepID=UPI001C98B856|nr:transglutaminase-like domain-containing protein [Microbulbifer agarilyticus]MBY6188882.1 transglutaminase-like domain-containing protein [Microbulbifer agarilyticus]